MLSVIIPVMGNCPYRKRDFVAVLEAVRRQNFSGYEVIVVEQYLKETFWDNVVGGTIAKYIPIKDKLNVFFCLSWCRNVGARVASGDTVVFLDADVVFGDDYFYRVIDSFDPGVGHMVGWRRCIYLNEQGSRAYLAGSEFSTDQAPHFIQIEAEAGFHNREGCGGIIIFDRRFYFDVLGGYNEHYLRWGREDKDAMYRARALTGRFDFLAYDILHLYHPVKRKRRPGIEALYRLTRSNPLEVSSLLVAAKLGKIEGRTIVDLPGLEEVEDVE